ncbi:prevent-host-death protein [Colwellia sp. RE-S-Sl-9]
MIAEDWEREQETLHVLQNNNLMKQRSESIKTDTCNQDYKAKKNQLDGIAIFYM